MSALDKQIGGGHYKDMKIQTMEFSMANNLNACQHTAIKYLCRYKKKGGAEDLDKAIHVIEMLKDFEYGPAGEMVGLFDLGVQSRRANRTSD